VVRPGQAPAQRHRPECPELAPGVPPLGAVHLADARDNKPEREQALEIDV
jgi:hypothetical protein